MKTQTQQKNNGCYGMTTFMLDSVTEAIDLVRSSRIYNPENSEKHFADRWMNEIGKDRFPDWSQDWSKEQKEIVRANPYYRFKYHTKVEDMKSQFDACVKSIYNGPGSEMTDRINNLTESLREMALEFEPSLAIRNTFSSTEVSDVWDPAAIAAGEERPCFHKSTENPEPKPGAGEGAYRLVINTDCPWSADPTTQAAALCALAMLLQEHGPVEIWVQQGWLGNSHRDGVTLFPVHKEGMVQPHTVYFWIGHKWKDSVFSFWVNKCLGRRAAAVSSEVELPCDLYIHGYKMPSINCNNKESVAEWVAKTARKLLFDEENPEKFGEY